MKFTHEGHKGAINDLGWNPHEMILGSAEEDDNTLQFYQIVRPSLFRPTTSTSWSTLKTWSI
jgi:WD40 repeat protein